MRVLSGITQFADAIPHVQFLQGLIDRLVDNQEPTEEDLKEFKRVQYYVKEKFGPIWKIIEPHSNHKSLIKTIFSHALITGKLNDIDLDSLADQLRLIFNSNVTTPAIFESITPLVTTMEALFSVSTFETFLANNFSDFNKYFEEFREDPEFVNSFYSAYDEISSLMDEKHTDIIASRDAADNKTDKKRLNAVISAFQKLSSDVRKEYNKLDTIEKQKLANQNKEQRKQDNIERQQKSKLVKDIKKRESAAAALAGIIKYANASGAELTARNIMQYIPEAKEETVHEPSYYRNIYAPCGNNILTCNQGHNHSFANCYAFVRTEYLKHIETCNECVNKLLKSMHPHCKRIGTFDPSFRSYYRAIIHCSNCMICPNCASTGTVLASCNPFYHNAKPEMYLANPIHSHDVKCYNYGNGKAVSNSQTILAIRVPKGELVTDYKKVVRNSCKNDFDYYFNFHILRSDDINTLITVLNDEHVQIHGTITRDNPGAVITELSEAVSTIIQPSTLAVSGTVTPSAASSSSSNELPASIVITPELFRSICEAMKNTVQQSPPIPTIAAPVPASSVAPVDPKPSTSSTNDALLEAFYKVTEANPKAV